MFEIIDPSTYRDYSLQNNILISRKNMSTISLFESLQSVTLLTQEAIVNSNSSGLLKKSAGGLAGGLMFGGLGAIAGIMLSSKNKTTTSTEIFACYSLDSGVTFTAKSDMATYQNLCSIAMTKMNYSPDVAESDDDLYVDIPSSGMPINEPSPTARKSCPICHKLLSSNDKCNSCELKKYKSQPPGNDFSDYNW